MRNRRGHGRRGLSTIVTSVMLVAAVSVMGVGILSWSSISFANQQREISNQTDSRINLIAESFIIEDVWFYTETDPPNANYADVTVRNTGDLAIRVSNIYVNNTQAWNIGEDILIGEVATISVQIDWESDRSQSIWVKTERGAEAKQVWKS
jgi:hypothetical protein